MNRPRRPNGALYAIVLLAIALPAWADDDPFPALQAQWWQWAFSIPRHHNPIYDNKGAYCAHGQRGDVWFLAGNNGGTTRRSCTVPAGVRVFIPVINVGCIYEPNVPPFDDLSDCLADTLDFVMGVGDYAGQGFSGLSVTLNGNPATMHFGTSDAFAAVVPANGIFSYRRGVYPAADVGWYYLSEPLPAGLTTLQVTGAGYGFGLDVTYRINAVDATFPD